MLSVMIFCHDKREGDLIGKICNQCVALIDKEFLRNFIISDEEYHQVNIEGIQPPDLLVVEITGIEDLCRAKRIRGIFPRGRSEERRVGKECSEPCRSRWSPYH